MGPGKTLFRVGSLARLILIVHAYERDAVRIRPDRTARVLFAALPGKDMTGTVTLVGSQVDSASRTIPVRIQIANRDGVLRPGMSATARVPVGDTQEKLVSVPAAALQRFETVGACSYPVSAGVFEVRPVGRGRDLGGEVEVLNRLQPGEGRRRRGLPAQGRAGEGQGRRRAPRPLRPDMIERLIRASTRKPPLVLVLVFAGALLGVVSWGELRRDVFPDLSAPVFNVIVQNPAMSAEELETAIAIPWRSRPAGARRARIRVDGRLPVCQITVEFEHARTPSPARQYVAERLAPVRTAAARHPIEPLLSSLTGRLNEIFESTIEADPRGRPTS